MTDFVSSDYERQASESDHSSMIKLMIWCDHVN